MASRRGSAGERVLEGRHVIGLFFVMMLLSAVFFTLGYVMGKGQLDAQVNAATTRNADPGLPAKPEPLAKAGKTNVSTPAPPENAPDANATPPSSDWEFYRAGDKKSTNDHLKPAVTTAAQPKAVATSVKPAAHAPAANGIPKGAYLLQVAALRKDSDAIAVANDLRKKKFPAFVQTPQGDPYYRVQVGPYTDQKAMQAAKKGLESAGFKAIVKH